MGYQTALKPQEHDRLRRAYIILVHEINDQDEFRTTHHEYFSYGIQKRSHYLFAERYDMNDVTHTRENLFNELYRATDANDGLLHVPQSRLAKASSDVATAIHVYLTKRQLGLSSLRTASKDRIVLLKRIYESIHRLCSRELTEDLLNKLFKLAINLKILSDDGQIFPQEQMKMREYLVFLR